MPATMPESFIVAQIAVSSASMSFDSQYSYLVPEKFRGLVYVGQRVLVPFGRADKRVVGFILKLLTFSERPDNIKPVIRLVDEKPLITDEQLRLILFLKENTFCTYYDAFRSVVPAGFSYVCNIHYTLANSLPEGDLTEEEQKTIDFIRHQTSQRDVDKFLDFTGDKKKKELVMSLIDKGVLEESEELKRRVSDSEQKMIRLSGFSEAMMPVKSFILFSLETWSSSWSISSTVMLSAAIVISAGFLVYSHARFFT